MTSIGVIGAGVGGLHLSLFLQRQGVSVTLYAERTPDEQRALRLPNTAAHWRRTRERERYLGVNHWDDAAQEWSVQRIHFWVGFPAPLDFRAELDVGGICVDQRLYTARLHEDFLARGGGVVYGSVQVANLPGIAEEHDLVVVSSGRGSLTELFRRRENSSPYTRPQRFLCTGIYRGVRLPRPVGLAFSLVPGQGELLELPYITFDGNFTTLFFEVNPGSTLEPLMHVRYEEDPARFERTVLESLAKVFPETYARVNEAEFSVLRPQDVFQGAITPTARRGFAQLPNGRWVVALGDVNVVNDPIMGQGANSASAAAFVLGQAIVDDNLAFDEMWCQRTDARMWDYHQSPFNWNNYMLRTPLPDNVIRLLHAAAREPRIASAFANNFDEPERNWNLVASPERTDAYLRRMGIDPERVPELPPPAGPRAATGDDACRLCGARRAHAHSAHL